MKNIEILKQLNPEYEFVCYQDYFEAYKNGIKLDRDNPENKSLYDSMENQHDYQVEIYNNEIIKNDKLNEIKNKMNEIDAKTIRCLRLIATGDDSENEFLLNYETQINDLRAEYKEIAHGTIKPDTIDPAADGAI